MSKLAQRGKYVPDYPIYGNETYPALQFAEDINREVDPKHVIKLKDKLNEYGWCDVIKIVPSGIILEGQHRVSAAKDCDETTVPAYILTWADDAEEDDLRQIITSLNNGNKGWGIFEYCKSFRNLPTYNVLYEHMIRKSDVSNGVILTIYTGKKTMGSFKGFTDGEFLSFKKKEFSDWLMLEIESLISTYGKSVFGAQTVRSLAANAFNEEIDGVVEHVIRNLRRMASDKSPIPEGDSQFTKRYDELKEEFLTIKHS